MQKYRNNVQDQFGNALSSVTVTVNENPGGAPATIFSDNGVTPKANPFVNDSDGEFNFYAENGRYDIELTGPLTESIVDIRLLDIAALFTPLILFTDIVTATPPTTEAVTGNYQIQDLDGTDLLAEIGYNASNALRMANRMHGGNVQLNAEDTAGVARVMVNADPDGFVTLGFAGAGVRARTDSAGVFAVLSNASTDAETRAVYLMHQDGTIRARLGQQTGSILGIDNQIHGGNVSITGEDVGGVQRSFLVGDPDALTTISAVTNLELQVANGETGVLCLANSETQLFANDVKTFIAASAGIVGIVGDLNSDIDNRYMAFFQPGGTQRARIGHFTGSDFHFRNEIHGGITQIGSEDAGGVAREMLQCDPDGITEIRAVTDAHLAVNFGNEIGVEAVANGKVGLRFNNIEELLTRDHAALTALTGAQVKHHDGNFYDIGLAKLPLNTISVAEDIDENNQQFYTRKNAGGAVTLELQSDSNIQTGTAWQIANVDTEDLTIDAVTNTVTLNFLDGGGVAPPTGNRTLAQAGVCTIVKIGVAEYDIFGNAGLT